MENNNFEKNIKNSFDQYLPQLDHDEIWENIEPHLKKKKKRRFFFIWFFGGLAILGGLLINIFYIENSTANHQKIKDKTESPSLLNSETDNSFITKKSSDSANKKTRFINESFNVKKKSASLEYSSSAPNVSTSASHSSSQEFLMAENNNSESGEINDLINLIPEQFSKKPVLSLEDTAEQKKSFIESGIEKMPLSTDSIEQNLPKNGVERDKKKRTKRSRNKAKWFIQPTLSAIVPLKILSQRNQYLETSYLQKRKDTETQLEAFSIGFNIQSQTRNGLVFIAGIEVQRLNSRFDFATNEVENKITNGIISITENASGDRIRIVSGDKLITKSTIRTQRFYNHHTFVNIPLGIGKHWQHSKYDFRLLGGIDINLYHNFKGLIRASQGDIDLRHRNKYLFDQTFKRKTGLGIWFATEFHKSINEKVRLSASPRIQIPFSEITQNNYPLKQKFINVNLTLGAIFLIEAPDK